MNTTLSRFIFLLFSTALIPRGSVLSSLMSSVFVNLMPSELRVLHESLNILNQWLKPLGKQKKISARNREEKQIKAKVGSAVYDSFWLQAWEGYTRELVGECSRVEILSALSIYKTKIYRWIWLRVRDMDGQEGRPM